MPVNTPTFITYYSFKGGVGRTQALANVALALANGRHNVVMIDMDLESPGLHSFFSPEGKAGSPFPAELLRTRKGLLEYAEHCQTQPKEEPNIEPFLLECTHEYMRDGRLRLLLPGRLDDTYADRVARFSWEHFYEEADGYRYMEHLRSQFAGLGADYVLIDSRTGLTDVGMIGTFQMPDILIVLFALHRQGIEGARRIASAVEHRRMSEGKAFRLRKILLLPSRVDESGETSELNRWMRIVREELGGIQGAELIDRLHERLPYFPRVAYGERVLDLRGDENPLSSAFKLLVERIGRVRTVEGATEDTLPPEGAPPFTKSLRRSAQAFQSRVQQLSHVLRTKNLIKYPLEEILQRARDADYQHSMLRAEFSSLQPPLAQLFEQAGEPFPDPLKNAGETLGDWEGIAPALVEQVERGVSAWSARVRAECLDIVQEEALLRDTWREIEQAIETASLEEALATIETAKEKLQGQSLIALLQRNELEPEILARCMAAEADKLEWVRGRLAYYLDETPDERVAARVFWNLLRLIVSMSDRLKAGELNDILSRVWTAYDFVCLYVHNQEENRDAALFEQVGFPLWQYAWWKLFEDWKKGSVDMAWPAGSDTRDQLVRMAKEQNTSVHRISEFIAEGLSDLIQGHLDKLPHQALARLFEQRRDDAGLRLAMLKIAGNDSYGKARRVVLAHYLYAEPYGEDQMHVLYHGFLKGLVADGYAGDALYALSMLVPKEPRMLEDQQAMGFLCTEFALQMAEQEREDALMPLLSDNDFLERTASNIAGEAFLMMAAAGYWGKDPGLGKAVRQWMLYENSRHLEWGELVRRQVEWLEHGGHIDEAVVRRIRALKDEAESIGGRGLFGGWPPGQHWKEDLAHFCEQEVERILKHASTEPPKVGASANPEVWIRDTLRDQRDVRHRKSDMPDGDARHKLVKALDDLRSVIESLIEIWASYRSSRALASLLKDDDERENRRAEFERGLATRISVHPPFASPALKRVMALLAREQEQVS